jgi:hypothetical protein
MSFRQFGGLNYSARHNIVSSNYNTSNNLLVTQNVGQPNSYINFLSDISGNVDISGNITAYYMFLSSGYNYSSAENAVMPKSYIDLVSTGIVPVGQVITISTTGNNGQTTNTTYPVPINSSNVGINFIIDGITLNVGDAVLLNDQVNQVNNGVYNYINSSGNYIFQRSTTILPLGTDAVGAFVSVINGTLYGRSGWVQTYFNNLDNAIVGIDSLIFSEFYNINFKIGQGLNITTSGNNSTINIDSSLNFINYLDSTIGNTGASGNLALGTLSTNTIIGPTGGNPVQFQSQIQAQKGITGPTGSFTYLNVSNNTNFVNLPTSTQTPTTGDQLITKSYADSTYTTSGNILGSNNSWTGINTFSNNTLVPGGITGATGSFNNLYVTNKAQFVQDINVNTLNIGLGGGNVSSNTAIGTQSLTYNTTGSQNTAIGYQSLYNNTIGTYNAAIGYQSLFYNLTGNNNTAIGYSSLFFNTTGSQNTAIGYQSLYNNTIGTYNAAIGYSSLRENTTGVQNTAIGTQSLTYNTTGSQNIAIGYDSLSGNTNGSYNTALGFQASFNGNYSYTTAIGAFAQPTSSNQIMLGGSNGGVYPEVVVGPIIQSCTGQVKIYESIGTGPYTQTTAGATPTSTSPTTGSLVISHNNSGGYSSILFPSNANNGSDYAYIQFFDNVDAGYPSSSEAALLLIGIENDSTGSAGPDRISLYADSGSGYIGINNLYPLNALDVIGNGNFTGSVTASSFNTTSDYRIKDNIQILNEYHNVDNLRPITYYNKKTGKQDIGLLAHEVQEYLPCLVIGEKDAKELQNINYLGLIPILIKEIQELKKEIKILKSKI